MDDVDFDSINQTDLKPNEKSEIEQDPNEERRSRRQLVKTNVQANEEEAKTDREEQPQPESD